MVSSMKNIKAGLRQYPDTWVHPYHVTELERLNGVQGKVLIPLGMTGIFTVFIKGTVGFKDMVDAICTCLDKQCPFALKM